MKTIYETILIYSVVFIVTDTTRFGIYINDKLISDSVKSINHQIMIEFSTKIAHINDQLPHTYLPDTQIFLENANSLICY